jgi:hypothetical protein
MVFLHTRIREDQQSALQAIPGSIAEHIRRAIDDYIQKHIGITASTSQSERREKTNG